MTMRVSSPKSSCVQRTLVMPGIRFQSLFRYLFVAGLACVVILLFDISSALASSLVPTPSWNSMTAGVPTLLPLGMGHTGRFDIIIENAGGAVSESGPVVRDVLPPGLRVTGTTRECNGVSTSEVECVLPEAVAPGHFTSLTISFEEVGQLAPGSVLHNSVEVGGGGSRTVVTEDTIGVQSEGQKGVGPAGVTHFEVNASNVAGEAASQAGGHPNFLTTSALFSNMYPEGVAEPAKPVEAVRDLVLYLPLGVLGDPAIADDCSVSLVETQPEQTGCPLGSRIGTIMPLILSVFFPPERGVYNITPEKGYAAEFGFASNGFLFVTYANVVRHNGTYMVRISIPGIPVKSAFIGFMSSFAGDLQESFVSGETERTVDRGAFLTDPSNCDENTTAREAFLEADTWEHPDPSLPLRSSSMVFPSLTGCESLRFGANLQLHPETTQADAPSGYEVGLELPQAPNSVSDLGTPPVRSTSVTFPVGTTISPSSANGLEGCDEVGPHGINIEGAESEEVAEDGLERPAPGHCPLASEIGTVRASTPLLKEELTGHVFLAKPECGGERQAGCTAEDAEDGKLVGLYLELNSPRYGVVIKLKGHASIKSGSGQVTASFDEIPQFPVSSIVVTTKHGEHAPFENQPSCGRSVSSASLTSWSPATPGVKPLAEVATDWNGAGQPCPASLPFAPLFEAGTVNPSAASTAPFTLTLKREDREQNIDTLSTTLPEGLLAYISKVTRCPEPQASEDSLSACPESSQIGTTTVAVGPGNDPVYVTGKVFFTGPYDGAPFGLSVVVPAVAGPFNLGDVHVRVRLLVDPHTAQATAVSDPLPQELDGVPLRLRTLNVTLTDREFVLNPTSCEKLSITGTVTSPSGGSAAISSPFAAEGCNKLAFNPAFSASTEANATKANGTGVKVKIAYPSSGEANVAKVVVGFPKQLPVRLETLQKACPAATFEANPAACPAASDVGSAIAHTPILAQPLTGPVYLVSYGNAKFPDAVFVLQAEGVTIEVDGQSFVSKSGALKVTFASVPDAPFSTFETVLPSGPHSQFTSVKTSGKAHGSQCGQNLVIPVSMVAHNGAQLNKNVQMQIAGCPPSVAIVKAKATAHALTVTVRTTAKGTLKLAGSGLKGLTKRGLGAGTHKLTLALTGAGQVAARARRSTQLKAQLTVGRRKASARREIAL